jgi:hypothetical protein
MKSTWKQLKDLPFSNAGSIWEINGNELKIDGMNYSYTHPELWSGLVKYYIQESGVVDMTSEWFERAGSEDEKKHEVDMVKEMLRSKKENLLYEIQGIEDSIKELESKESNN